MTDEELLQLIEQAARNRTTYLMLRDKKLTALPPEIGQLSNLTTLNLRTCFLNGFGTFLGAETGFLSLKMAVSLPKVWSNSSQKPGFFFKKHALRYNQLVVLPPEIGLLTNLRILHPGL